MEWLQILKSIIQEPLMLCLLLISFVLAILSIPVYFHAIRPRRGTTEWMRKVEERSFGRIWLHALGGADIVWALMVAACAACMRFCFLFFQLRLHLRSNALEILLSASEFFMQRVLLCALFALCIFFTVRLLYGKALPAICTALLGALLQNFHADTVTLFLLSLLFFLCWMNGDRDGMLRGIWLLLSLAVYGLCLLGCWELFWLSLLYAVGYVMVLIRRCRDWDQDGRTGKVLLSLITMILLLPLGGMALWLMYARLSGRMTMGLAEAIRSFSFYEEILPVLKEKIYGLLTQRGELLAYVQFQEAFLFLAGLGACIPALHMLIRERDSKVILLLVLFAAVIGLWLLSSINLLMIPLLLLLGRLWSVLCRRGKSGFCVLSSCLLMAVTACYMILY